MRERKQRRGKGGWGEEGEDLDEDVEVGRKGDGMEELRGEEGKDAGDVVILGIIMPMACEGKSYCIFSSFGLLRQIGEAEPSVSAEPISVEVGHKHPLSATGELDLEGS